MLAFYKPNGKNSGAACSWSYRPSEGKFFVSMIKQASWNAGTRTGSFAANKNNPSAKIVCKFGAHEIGSILSTIEKGIDFSTYHRSEKQNLQIVFKKYPYKDKEGNEFPGFSLGLTKDAGGEKVYIVCGFTVGESRALREYLITALQDQFRRAFMWRSEQKEEVSVQEEQQETVAETPEEPRTNRNEEYLPQENEQVADNTVEDLW